MKKSILLFNFFLSFCAFAQKQANVWYFGSGAGIDFNSGSPVALTNSAMNTSEGCASLADVNGSLLFYTDGITVWDKTHSIMPNGTGLKGHPSSTQAAIIVPLPGSKTIYYIFTTDYEAHANGFNYSIVDMTLNGGLGDVTIKNKLLYTPTTEKITAVTHKNGCDIWIISHPWGTNEFKNYLLKSTGLDTIPIVSASGTVMTGFGIGQLKSSPNGARLALATSNLTVTEIYDFNNQTGVVSNPMTINHGANYMSYGIEFSPNNNLLYVSFYASPVGDFRLRQYDISLPTQAAIQASEQAIYISNSQQWSLQVGPDKKIYFSLGTAFLSVINNPDVYGAGCNFSLNAIPLSGKISGAGLPDFIGTYFYEKPKTFTVSSDSCSNKAITFSQLDSSYVSSFKWDFGDPASGSSNTSSLAQIQHTYVNPGTYNVQLVLNRLCENDTINQTIKIKACIPLSVLSSSTAISCNGNSTGNATANSTGGTKPYSYSWSNGQTDSIATGLSAGIYTVTITDALNNTTSTSIVITEPNPIIATLNTNNATCGNTNGSIAFSVSGGAPSYIFSWITIGVNPDTLLTNMPAGNYTLVVTDNNGCSKSFNTSISNANGPTLTVLQTNNVSCYQNTNGLATVSAGNSGTKPFTYAWSTTPIQTDTIATALTAGTYTVTITDANGCTNSKSVNITQPNPLSASLIPTNYNCNKTYGKVISTPSGGTSPFIYSWSNGASTDSINNLIPGIYSLTITDKNGCTTTATTNITIAGSLSISLSKTNASCSNSSNGSATVTSTSGVGTCTYSWNSTPPILSNAATGLPEGTYTVFITDSLGCTGTQFVSVGATTTINVIAGNDSSIYLGASATLQATGATNYSWSPATNLNCTTCAQAIATPSVTTTYFVTGQTGSCSDIDSITIYVLNDLKCSSKSFWVPNAFSPNGDHVNDYLFVHGDDCIRSFLFQVFNRWGELVFETKTIKNGWDGIFSNASENTAIFVYQLKVELNNGELIEKKGNITLLK